MVAIHSNKSKTFWETFAKTVKECSVPDWDGYEALPLHINSVNSAKEFMRSLFSIPFFPELSPDAEGDLGLLWRKGDKTLIISIDKNSVLSYAWRHPIYGRGGFSVKYKLGNKTLPHISSIFIHFFFM